MKLLSTKKNIVVVIFSLGMFSAARGALVEIASFDLVDDFLKVGGNYTGPGNYDIFTATDGSISPDGTPDIAVSITTTGLTANDGNNVSWSASNDTTGTGLRSTLDLSFVAGGGVTANNSGYRVSQTIEIRFLTLQVEAKDITDVSFSSGNTNGIAWEFAIMEFLDSSGNPFSTTPTIGTYSTHTAINGVSGLGTYVADDPISVANVGTNKTASNISGPMNSISGTDPDSPSDTGIADGVLIGGIRFTHYLEDVRGVNNGDTLFTSTINDFDLVNFQIPEPTSTTFLIFPALLALRFHKRLANS